MRTAISPKAVEKLPANTLCLTTVLNNALLMLRDKDPKEKELIQTHSLHSTFAAKIEEFSLRIWVNYYSLALSLEFAHNLRHSIIFILNYRIKSWPDEPDCLLDRTIRELTLTCCGKRASSFIIFQGHCSTIKINEPCYLKQQYVTVNIWQRGNETQQ